MEKEERFNVEIFEYATGITSAVIGKDMNKKRAEKRQETGLSRCNSNFGVRLVKLE